MPTYEYKCAACGHTFERFQSIMANPIKRCPECGKAKVKRLLGTGAGVIFKGSGFYTTDYRSDAYNKSAKADSGGGGEKSDTTTSAEKSGGDKPAAEKSSGDKPPAKDAVAKSEPAKSETPAASKSAAKPASKPSKGKRS
jgi:putative FmdB family regulatory protein